MFLNFGFGFILGTLLGSLSKALADRSVGNETFWGRSYCESCKHKLSWYDLFPLFSYFSTKGKCRYCKKNLSYEYPLVEFFSGILIGLLLLVTIPQNFLLLPQPNQLVVVTEVILKAFAIVILVVVFLTDLKTGLIPDRITYPAVIIGFFYQLLEVSIKMGLFYLSSVQSSLGRFLMPPYSDYYQRHLYIIIFGFLNNIATGIGLGLFFLSLIVLTRGRGMGGGDMKLGIFIGLILGFPLAIIALMLSFLTGAGAGVMLLLIGKKKFGQTIPFGPFLSLGAILSIFWGEKILNWYLNLKYYI